MYREHRAEKSGAATAARVYASLLLAASLAAPAGAQWYWRHPQPQGNNLRAVDFTDALHGTAVGDFGTILTTTDGGKTWLLRDGDASQLNARFFDVSFADQANGLAVGQYSENGQLHGLILGTTDGGATWVTRETFPGVDVVTFITYVGDTAYAIGRVLTDPPIRHMILRSTDGGFTWERLDFDPSLRLNGLAIADENVAVAVGLENTAMDGGWEWEGTILRTTDGWETWTAVEIGTSEHLGGVSFLSPEIGIAVGGNGMILRTTDGGNTWTPQESGTMMGFYQLSFSDSNYGVMLGTSLQNPTGVVLTTTDGGTTWSSRPCEAWCFAIDAADAGVATLVGADGAILRTTDAGVTWEQQGLWLNASWFRAVSYVGPNTATAVGGGCSFGESSDCNANATIVRTDDGGNTWVTQESGTPLALFDVFFVDEDFGLAVGGKELLADLDRVILRTTDGGDHWEDVTPPDLPEPVLRAVTCVDASTCMGVGTQGIVVRTQNAGESWTVLREPGGQRNLNDVDFVDETTGTAVGRDTILRTTDGGVTWEPQSLPSGDLFLEAVAFTDVNTGFAVGSSPGAGVILRTTDGGESWVLNEVLPGAATGIDFADANNGAVVTLTAHVYRTQDGGESWELDQRVRGGEYYLFDVSFPDDATTGMAVGRAGAVFKTVGGPTFAPGLSPSNPRICVPDSGTDEIPVGVTVESVAGYSGTVALSTTGEPSGVTSQLSTGNVEAPGTALWTLTVDPSVALGRHVITLTGDDGTRQQIAQLRLDVFEPAPAPLLVEPANGAIDVDLRPVFAWEAMPDVDTYRLQIATDAAFEELVIEAETTGAGFTPSGALDSNTQYFWRVRGTRGCAGAWSEVFSFTTLPLPVVEVTPEELGFEAPIGGSDSATLTIANVGTGNLDWSIETAQPPAATVSGSFADRSFADSSGVGTTANSSPAMTPARTGAAVDLATRLGEPLPGLRVVDPANGVVDCDAAPGITIHDDGTIENGYSGDPATVSLVSFVDQFTPSAYPATFTSVCVAYLTVDGGPSSYEVEIVVFDDDGANGGPGTELGALTGTVQEIPVFPNATPVWASFDISSLGITVTEGSLYIGARWVPASPTGVFLASDESSDNPPGFAGGYWWNDADNAWAPIASAFPDYRSMFIRAQAIVGGCDDPGEIPWLSVTPDSGSVPQGGSTPVEVAADATGLEAGEHVASLCLSTNDVQNPLAVVPVSLVVTEGGVALAFDPSSLAFGDVDVGTSSVSQTALLENLGSGEATGVSFTVPGDGFEADTGACGDSLPGGGSCEVSVTFSPLEPGPAESTVVVTSDQGPTATLELQGNGIQDPPQIDVEPDSLSSTLEEGETETLPLTIANPGDLPLDWTIPDGDIETFERVGAITLEGGETNLLSAVIDPAGEFAYFGTEQREVVKIDLATFERVGVLSLEFLEIRLASAMIDPVGEFAYFGTAFASPARVVKIDLATFKRVGAITLEGDDGLLASAVIDPAGAFAYFGAYNNLQGPDRVVKIDLATFERVGAITLEGGETNLRSAVIDPAGEFAYFGTGEPGVPGSVVKIDLESFERVDAVTLESGETDLRSAVIDPTGEFAYFGTGTNPGRVVRIDLQTFERVDAVVLEGGEVDLRSAVMDPTDAIAYFGTHEPNVPGRVVKIDLETFDRVDGITMESGEDVLDAAVIDPAGGFAYFGAAFTPPHRVVKIDLRRHECTLPDWVGVASTSGSVPRDGSEEVVVTFDAAGLSPGDYTANLCVTSNDPDQPVTKVPLELTVTPPSVSLTFDPADLAFGDVEVGDSSAPLSATLHNGGVEAATGLSFGLGDDAFTADTGNCGTSLPAGGSCTVSVIFAPTGPGPAAATLVASSAGGAGAELALAGNGVAAGVVTPTGLEVDPEELLSDGNGVFEPGEVVIVAPWWRNDGLLPKSLAGEASDFVGPDGVPHTVEEESASYGMLDPGQSKSCLDNDTCYVLVVGDPAARPATHWEATFDEALDDAADTGKTWTLHIGGSFTDVPSAHLFYSSIETLLHSGVTGGCVDDRYCPGGVNTRAQMPVFVLKALEGADYTPPPCEEGETEFADVPAANPFCPWIEDLAGRGIVAGCGNDNYCPSAPVTRAQMAIFLLKTLEGAGYSPPECSNRFDDVPCPSLFADWIEELAAREITGGCSANEYCPGAPVSRAQMAVFVTKTFGLTLYGP